MACWLCNVCDSSSQADELRLLNKQELTSYPYAEDSYPEDQKEAPAETNQPGIFESGILKRNMQARKEMFIERWGKLSAYDLQLFKSKISELIGTKPLEVITISSIESVTAYKKDKMFLVELQRAASPVSTSARAKKNSTENLVFALGNKTELDAWINAFNDIAGLNVEFNKN